MNENEILEIVKGMLKREEKALGEIQSDDIGLDNELDKFAVSVSISVLREVLGRAAGDTYFPLPHQD